MDAVRVPFHIGKGMDAVILPVHEGKGIDQVIVPVHEGKRMDAVIPLHKGKDFMNACGSYRNIISY